MNPIGPPLRLVVIILGAVLVLSVAGVIALAITSVPVPDVLQNIAVGTLTGLVGLLVQTNRKEDQ